MKVEISIVLAFGMFFVVDACSTPKHASKPDWKKLHGKWTWAMNSDDKLTEIFKCSPFNVRERGKTSKITMNLKFGPLAHQIYSFKADHISGNEYLLTKSFSSSWGNIMRYNYPFEAKSILSEATDERSPISFYVDKKQRCLIAVACLPNNKEAVWAFTKKKHTTEALQKLIERELERNGVTTTVTKSNCPAPRSGKKE